MIIGDKIIFSHLQKTGGTYISSELIRIFPDLKKIKTKHEVLTKSLVKDKELVIGSIRDPHSYYLSLWSYGCQKRGGLRDRLCSKSSNINSLIKLIFSNSNFNLFDFNIYKNKRWNFLYSDINNYYNFREWLYLINDKKSFFDTCLPISDEMDNGLFLGFYSRRFINQYFEYKLSNSKIIRNSLNCYVNTWINMNDMDNSLSNALKKIKEYENFNEEIFEISKTKINESNHRDLVYYYDKETKKYISQIDNLIINTINEEE